MNTKMTIASTGAMRENKGKSPLSWVPRSLAEAVAQVLYRNSDEAGGRYPRNNWRKGLPWSETLDSLMRHANAIADGEDIDPEDGLPHIFKVATNAAFLIEYRKTHPEMDNLYKPEKK